jgi:hypothetical protein
MMVGLLASWQGAARRIDPDGSVGLAGRFWG